VPFDWKNPDYSAVFAERTERLMRLRADPSVIPALCSHYRNDPAQFIDDFGCTYDPRLPARGLPSVVPFVLFDKQREWINWVVGRWQAGDPGLTEKSRDMGVSWLAIALSCTLCLFHEGLAIGFGSRKEEYVDRSGSPKSLFWKGRQFLQLLPPEFLNGWTPKDAPHLRISFPGSGSVITGEAGDNIGRGDRSSIYFTDEEAFLERPHLVEASLSQTTDCRISVSTPHGMANPFAVKRHSWPPERIFVFDWRDDPRKGEEWYARQVELLDEVTLAQEVDRNYSASVSGVVIHQAWVQASVDAHVLLGFEPTGRRRGALDVADEGVDLNALCVARGVLVERCPAWSGKGSDTFATTQRAFALCDVLGLEEFDYDADGLGSFVRGDARVINEQRKRKITVNAWRGSGGVVFPDDPIETAAPRNMRLEDDGDNVERLNGDYYMNAKAQAWFSLRVRFQRTYRAVEMHKRGEDWREAYHPDDLISLSSKMPELAKVTQELSQPTYTQSTTGKMVIVKMQEGQRSPNHGDGVMMRFAPREPASTYDLRAWSA
jgi:phage terminase large subunit